MPGPSLLRWVPRCPGGGLKPGGGGTGDCLVQGSAVPWCQQSPTDPAGFVAESPQQPVSQLWEPTLPRIMLLLVLAPSLCTTSRSISSLIDCGLLNLPAFISKWCFNSGKQILSKTSQSLQRLGQSLLLAVRRPCGPWKANCVNPRFRGQLAAASLLRQTLHVVEKNKRCRVQQGGTSRPALAAAAGHTRIWASDQATAHDELYATTGLLTLYHGDLLDEV